MLTHKIKKEYYQALLAKSSDYDGVFFVGIKTTGVFCRPTCPARKPKFENCEFFNAAQEALLASYRPCKRCCPLSYPNQVSETVRLLVEAVEDHPEKHWKDKDFEELSTNAKQASRLFKKRFGMTFVAYARARRMGIAIKQIKQEKSVIDAQLSVGYESGSGFREAFSRIMGATPMQAGEVHLLKAAWIDTQLGPMLTVADEKGLYLLEFVDRRGLEREIERLRSKARAAIVPGSNDPIESIKQELEQYFKGERAIFQTPIVMMGTLFQRQVWKELQKIPPGETRSYTDLAKAIGKPSAFRAVARANGANQLAILLPCHRVIQADGKLAGYGGGVARKEWLLKHEERWK